MEWQIHIVVNNSQLSSKETEKIDSIYWSLILSRVSQPLHLLLKEFNTIALSFFFFKPFTENKKA